ncbi:MAG: DLW-39 family protein [Mycobacteriales bacterium]
MRRPVLLVALFGLLAVLLRRRVQAGQAEKDLWTEATAPPDLR